MAQNQFGSTSFIPKKPQASSKKRRKSTTINIFFLIALLIFLGASAASVGAYFYLQLVERSIEEKSIELANARAAYEPALIEDLQKMDRRIQAAQSILDNHQALSSFFEFLESATLQNVQFDSFRYTVSGGSIDFAMNGKARSFSSVALQSDIFGNDSFIRNSLFSNLNLDEIGNVTFSYTATLDPSLVSYRSLVAPLTSSY